MNKKIDSETAFKHRIQRRKGHSHNGVFQSLFHESMLFLQDETQDAMRKLAIDNGSFHLNTFNFFCGLGRVSILKTCNSKRRRLFAMATRFRTQCCLDKDALLAKYIATNRDSH